MATKIYLIRHGESVANKVDVFLGHTDLELSDSGLKQAEKTAVFLKEKEIDKIYSSDLIRAYKTAKITANLKKMEVYTDVNLREIYAGAWENLTFSDIQNKFPIEYETWVNNIGLGGCPGGESILKLRNRVSLAIENLAKLNDKKTIAIFSHATAIRAFASYCLNYPLEKVKDVAWPTNASVTTVVYDNGKFDLIKYSEDGFLGDLVTKLPDNI